MAGFHPFLPLMRTSLRRFVFANRAQLTALGTFRNAVRFRPRRNSARTGRDMGSTGTWIVVGGPASTANDVNQADAMQVARALRHEAQIIQDRYESAIMTDLASRYEAIASNGYKAHQRAVVNDNI